MATMHIRLWRMMLPMWRRVPMGSCVCRTLRERTPLNDPEARGVFFGLTGRHTRAHMVRAALEGVAYTVASHVDIIEREHGLPIGRIMLVGGGTKNPV